MDSLISLARKQKKKKSLPTKVIDTENSERLIKMIETSDNANSKNNEVIAKLTNYEQTKDINSALMLEDNNKSKDTCFFVKAFNNKNKKEILINDIKLLESNLKKEKKISNNKGLKINQAKEFKYKPINVCISQKFENLNFKGGKFKLEVFSSDPDLDPYGEFADPDP